MAQQLRGRRAMLRVGLQALQSPHVLARNTQRFPAGRRQAHGDTFLRAYRWQYIATGATGARFGAVLQDLVTPGQMQRVGAALAPILAHAGR